MVIYFFFLATVCVLFMCLVVKGQTFNKIKYLLLLQKCSTAVCAYVQANSDLCEGGGYLLWTEMEVCQPSGALQLLTVVGALMFFLFLFLHLSTTADTFFCKNIASIVDLHKISQNIAGITFMVSCGTKMMNSIHFLQFHALKAFGNGAPDIFSSIASVTSVSRPRADLAISELLGGGIFVTTCVIGAISCRSVPPQIDSVV